MLKVDIHTHILPKEIPGFKEKFGYGGFMRLDHHAPDCARMVKDDGTFFRDIGRNTWDVAIRREECRQHSVDVQVLSTVPVMFSYWTQPRHGLELSRFLNDHLASVVTEHPRHFVALGNLPMQDPDLAIQELERCMGKLKFAGVQIGTNVNGANLDDPKVFPVFQAAEKLGAAIFIHPWEMLGRDRMAKYWLPWLVGMPAEISLAICSLIFGGVLERLPRLRLAFAHGGGAFASIVGRVGKGYEARPDLCAVDNAVHPREYLGRFFVDSLVHDERALRHCLSVFGENRVALGSDYPFPLGEEHPGKLVASLSGLSSHAQGRILGGNALEWLGRQEKDFR